MPSLPGHHVESFDQPEKGQKEIACHGVDSDTSKPSILHQAKRNHSPNDESIAILSSQGPPESNDPANNDDLQPANDNESLFLTPDNPGPPCTDSMLVNKSPPAIATPLEDTIPTSSGDPPPPLPRPPEAPAPKTKSNLPGFKRPTRRSPRKHSAPNDTGTPPRPVEPTTLLRNANVQIPEAKHTGKGPEQVADAWSAEAWELFGCGRDGVKCSLGEFMAKKG